MKTDGQKLVALINYLELNRKIACRRLWAEEAFHLGADENCWHFLLLWCETKDERSKMWKWFQDYYPDAIMLKEGV